MFARSTSTTSPGRSKSSGRRDEEIQKDVLAELKWDARVAPTEIGVSVKDGIVTLSGAITSYAKKGAAEEAAHRVRGVKAVANDLEVVLPSSGERTDEVCGREGSLRQYAIVAAGAKRSGDWRRYSIVV